VFHRRYPGEYYLVVIPSLKLVPDMDISVAGGAELMEIFTLCAMTASTVRNGAAASSTSNRTDTVRSNFLRWDKCSLCALLLRHIKLFIFTF